MPDTAAVTVLAQTFWEVHWGGINNLGGLIGQLTQCAIAVPGELFAVVCYVRENVALNHFSISGGERQALKRGALARRHPQVLELCAPPECWEDIARVVAGADGLARRVRRNRNFTVSWAERAFRQRKRAYAP